MMKKFIVLFYLLGACLTTFAQKDLLVLNEQNKLSYYHVTSINGSTSATSLIRTIDFLHKNYPGITLHKSEAGDSTLAATGKMMLYKKSMLSGQEDGEVNYHLQIDFKGDRYRILANEFTYTPYKRTRYGTFAPVNGISISLDNTDGKLSVKQVDTYLAQIGTYSATLDRQLQRYLQNPTPIKENKPALKKVNTNNW